MYDDIIIASRQNSTALTNNSIHATVLSGDTYNQNNQIGFDFAYSLTGAAIASIVFDLSNDANAYFDTAGDGSTAPSIGSSTVGISSSDVTFDAPDDSSTLTVNFAQGSFSAGDSFWFGVDTDDLGSDTGADYGLERAQVTITYDDGTTESGVYQANADGTSSIYFGGNTLAGDAGNDVIIGNSNDEVLVGGSGDDQLLGGAGDDILITDGLDSVIDGGVGFDTVILNNGINLDFSDTNIESIANIEKIDMIDGDHAITNLTLSDVLDMTDSGNGNTLEITGDASDTLEVDTTGWTQQSAVDNGDNTTYNYTTGSDGSGDSISLTVDDEIITTGM